MTDTYRFTDLIDLGQDDYSVRKQVRSGDLDRVRHGGYAPGLSLDSPEARHLALIHTTSPLLADSTVLSHASAALLWGLPVPRRLFEKVHLTHDRAGGGNIRTWTHTHSSSLSAPEVTTLNGVQVTSLARTAIDTSLLCHNHEALQILDAAWRKLGSAEELLEISENASRRRGIKTVRWALSYASPLSESAGESLSRYWMIMGNVPMPTLQFEVYDAMGNFLGRADFAWEEYSVLGEYDGRIKYDSSLGNGPGTEVVMSEKYRENGFRSCGWWVYRWLGADLRDGMRFASRLRRFLNDSPTRRVI